MQDDLDLRKTRSPVVELIIDRVWVQPGDPCPQIDFSELEKFLTGPEHEAEYAIASRQKHLQVVYDMYKNSGRPFALFFYRLDERMFGA